MDLLSEFNRQVLRYQDDAYTLAWYLAGSGQRAEVITQAAVEEAFKHFTACPQDCRLLLLKEVTVHAWRSPTNSEQNKTGKDIFCDQGLSHLEQAALALVDGLRLSYQDAAFVLSCSQAQTAHFLALARFKQSQSISLEVAAAGA